MPLFGTVNDTGVVQEPVAFTMGRAGIEGPRSAIAYSESGITPVFASVTMTNDEEAIATLSSIDDCREILDALAWQCLQHECGYTGTVCRDRNRTKCHILYGISGFFCTCSCHTVDDGLLKQQAGVIRRVKLQQYTTPSSGNTH